MTRLKKENPPSGKTSTSRGRDVCGRGVGGGGRAGAGGGG